MVGNLNPILKSYLDMVRWTCRKRPLAPELLRFALFPATLVITLRCGVHSGHSGGNLPGAVRDGGDQGGVTGQTEWQSQLAASADPLW